MSLGTSKNQRNNLRLSYRNRLWVLEHSEQSFKEAFDGGVCIDISDEGMQFLHKGDFEIYKTLWIGFEHENKEIRLQVKVLRKSDETGTGLKRYGCSILDDAGLPETQD